MPYPVVSRILTAALWLGSVSSFGAETPAVRDDAVPASEGEATIELPEYEVRDTRPWSYVEVPGCEILSLVTPRETEIYAKRVRAEQSFLRLLLPPAGRLGTHQAFVAILGDPQREPTAAKPATHQGVPESRTLRGGDDRTIILRSNLDTSGLERPAFFGTDRELRPLGNPTSVGRAQVDWTLQHHRELPAWLRHGLKSVFLSLTGVEHGRILFTGFALSHTTWRDTGLMHAVFENPAWDPRDERRKYRDAKPTEAGAETLTLFPLRRVFAVADRLSMDLSGSGLTRDEQAAFVDHCELFLHWGLWAEGGRYRAALERFIAAAVAGPIDEAVFTGCFGFGFTAAETSLAHYLTLCAKTEIRRLRDFAEVKAAIELGQAPGAAPALLMRHADAYLHGWIGRPGTWWFRRSNELPLPKEERERNTVRVAVRSATRGEVARLVGEVYLWSAVAEISRRAPRRAASPAPDAETVKTNRSLIEKSRAALERPYAEGERDPRLLATLGFLEFKFGRRTEARRLFEAAAAAKVAWPAVYLELARFRLSDALAAPGGKSGHPTEEQLQPVQDLVRGALGLFPEMPEAQVLSASLWSMRTTPPPAGELAALTVAARHQPWETLLVVHVATLHARAGAPSEAAALARLGLAHRIPGAPKELMDELRRLAAEPKS